MRVALFTNAFPGRANTFFVRDLEALLGAGIDVQIFPLYPEQPEHWQQVPESLVRRYDLRSRVHFCPEGNVGVARRGLALGLRGGSGAHARRVLTSSLRFGTAVAAKSLYGLGIGAYWAERAAGEFDLALSYWGNYAATSALIFRHRNRARAMKYGFYLHAGIDLYRDQAYLAEKLGQADLVVTVCEFNRRFLQELYPADFARFAPRLHVHHLGLDLQELAFRAEGRESAVILGVGHHSARKGFDDVIRVVGQLRDQGVATELWLVGEGPETPRLRQLAADLGVGDRVRFEGWLPFEAVADRMRRATLLMHASPELGDAVPTVIKEAMAVGLPVVGTHVAGIPELLDQGRCGSLVAPRDLAALTRAARAILEDRTGRLDLAHRARAFAEQTFDQRRNGARLVELLRQTVDSPRR